MQVSVCQNSHTAKNKPVSGGVYLSLVRRRLKGRAMRFVRRGSETVFSDSVSQSGSLASDGRGSKPELRFYNYCFKGLSTFFLRAGYLIVNKHAEFIQ